MFWLCKGDRLLKTISLTKELAEEIVELFKEGCVDFEVCKRLGLSHSVFLEWVLEAFFGKPKNRSVEQKILRDGFFDVMLSDIVLRQALMAISQTQEKRTRKVTRLLNLTASDLKALERNGNAEFLEAYEGAVAILKIEETEDVSPPSEKLIEKLLSLVEGGVSVDEIVADITPFNPPSDELEEV